MDIREYLHSNLRLARDSGKWRIMAACPIHKGGMEKHPSFSVNAVTGRFYCFACHVRGDIHDLKKLIGSPGEEILLDREDQVEGAEPEYNEEIDPGILGIFRMCPKSLLDAGFTMETLDKHNIGFDALYDRVTYPIFDSEGCLRAISGRAPDGEEPRYMVYSHWQLRKAADKLYKPQSKQYLWREHLVTRGSRDLIVVEGYKAAMWVYQLGHNNVVATMGTELTDTQIHKLQRYSDRVILLFDMDDPGRQSTLFIRKLLTKNSVVTFCPTYSTKQPDGLTAEELKSILPKEA